MWLDRFSNHATPNGSPPPAPNRASFQDPPRRPTHLVPNLPARPAFNARSSSLSGPTKANESTTSLLGAPKLTNGSTLKNESPSPAFFEDPVLVLQRLVGSPLPTQTQQGSTDGDPTNSQKPQSLDADIEFNGLSLEGFVSDSTETARIEPRWQTRSLPVAEYEKERSKYEELHRSVTSCDDVLKSVEVSLTSFQRDLGLVSAEIETLQTRSAAMNTRLDNRNIVEKLLGPAVEDVSISPIIVQTISEGPINEEWAKALTELEKRAATIQSKAKLPKPSKAIHDVKPLIDDLTAKAVERIRDFLVAQIKALRSPSINAQIIQQQSLLPQKELYGFLGRHHAQLAEEIGQAYINTMRWYYLYCFTRYRQALEKIPLYPVDKMDVLGADPNQKTTRQTPTGKLSPLSHDALSIGRRAVILKPATTQTALPSYVAEEEKASHYIETPFHNLNLALIDNASFEYSFLTEFFSTLPGNTFHQLSRRFALIFDPTFALAQAYTKELVEHTYDCLGILLCVRLNQQSAFDLQRRKIPVAEGYINGTNILLWPRFQVLMDAHAESVKHLTSTLSTRSAGPGAAAKLLFAGTSDSSPGGSKGQSTAPHQLTQRFGQFLNAILAISADAGDDEPVANSLARLRNEFEAFLVKGSKGVGGDQRMRERFLSNNYSLILTIVEGMVGKLASEQRRWFEGLKEGLGRG